MTGRMGGRGGAASRGPGQRTAGRRPLRSPDGPAADGCAAVDGGPGSAVKVLRSWRTVPGGRYGSFTNGARKARAPGVSRRYDTFVA